MVQTIKAEDIMTQNYKWIHEDESLAKALAFFEKSTDVLVVFDKNKNYEGILTERMILRSGLNRDKTKVKTLKVHAPKIQKTTFMPECARLMMENDVMNLPVFEDGKLVGVIDDIRLLKSVAIKKFGQKKVKNFMSDDVHIVSPKDKISGVLRCFREFHISRTPVVEDGKIVGIITLHDIITKVICVEKRASYDILLDEKMSFFDLPVENIMSYPVITCHKDATVQDVIQKIIEYNVSGILVVDDFDTICGITTKRDLLEPLSEERTEVTYPIIQFNSKLHGIYQDDLRELVLQFIAKYRKKLENASFYFYLREHKERSKGNHLIYVRCRINGPYGRFTVTAEGWGPIEAIKNAILYLEKQIHKKMSREVELEREYKQKFMKYVEMESLT